MYRNTLEYKLQRSSTWTKLVSSDDVSKCEERKSKFEEGEEKKTWCEEKNPFECDNYANV